MTGSSRKTEHWIWPLLLIAASAAVMLTWTWGTWLNPFIDFGRELYVPWRITEGEVLYSDIAYFNGPLSAYWNALLFRLFGVGLRTLVVGNLCIAGAVAWLLHGLVARVADRFTAAAAAVVFVVLFAFGQLDGTANFNWITPYSHEMTHGIALSLLAISAVAWWRSARQGWPIIVAGAATGLVFLTKPEVFLACIGAVLVGLVATLADESLGRRRVVRSVLAFGLAFVVPVGLAVTALTMGMPVTDSVLATLGGWRHAFDPRLAELDFYRNCTGLDAPVRRLAWVAACSAVWAVVLLSLVFVTTRLRPGTRHHVLRITLVAAATLGAGVAVLLFWPFGEPLIWYAYLALPVVVLLWLGLALARWRRANERSETRRSYRVASMFAVFAMLLTLKMILNARVSGYGFGLAVPAVSLCVAGLLHRIPAYVTRRGGGGFRPVGLVILAVLGSAHLFVFDYWIRYRSQGVGRGADAFRMPARTAAIGDALREIEKTRPDATLVVMPEGVTLNYLARRRNPTPFINFMPPELIMFGESAIVASLERARPDFVLLLTRPTQEYGLPMFGTDYGEALVRWVRDGYVEERAFGPAPLHPDRVADRQFGVRLLRRARR